MKKIGIVSCYFQHNYGSMLQAYATQLVIDRLGYSNETISISGFSKEIKKSKFIYFIRASFTSDILFIKMGMVFNLLRKKLLKSNYTDLSEIRAKRFEDFARGRFRLSKEYGSKKELHDVCSKVYSTIIVGSDQLWLPANIAADYYTLNFVPEEINTVSYSTSFGQSVLPKKSLEKAKVFLRKIKHVSVREESGQKLIESLTGRKVPVVCDPTLLFTGEEWLDIQDKEAIIKESYIFCYFLSNNPKYRDFAKQIKSETNCIIVALTHIDEYVACDEGYADMTPYDIGPAEFLNLIRHASYVCTDSFHCSVFSILYERNFFTFRRFTRRTKQSTNSRLDTLFNSLGMDNHIMNGDEDVTQCLKMRTDYNLVHKRLKIVREASYNYLYTALEGKANTDCDNNNR